MTAASASATDTKCAELKPRTTKEKPKSSGINPLFVAALAVVVAGLQTGAFAVSRLK